MELAARYPERVRRVVAHEPPCYRLLAGAEREDALRSHPELQETFRREGATAALRLMIARSGVNVNDREPGVALPAAAPAGDPQAAQRSSDLQHFLEWDMPAVTRYQPEVDALKAAREKIVFAVGAGSGNTLPNRCAVALGETLGAPDPRTDAHRTGGVSRRPYRLPTAAEGNGCEIGRTVRVRRLFIAKARR